MVSDEKGLPDWFVPGEKRPDGSGIDLATTENVKWVARLGSQTYGNPTVAGGRVFVGTNDFGLGDPQYTLDQGRRAASASTRPPASCSGSWSSPRETDPSFNSTTSTWASARRRPWTATGVPGHQPRRGAVPRRHGMANGNDGRSGRRPVTVGPGKPPVAPARRRRHRLALRHDRPSCPSGRRTPPTARSWSTAICSTSARPTASTARTTSGAAARWPPA